MLNNEIIMKERPIFNNSSFTINNEIRFRWEHQKSDEVVRKLAEAEYAPWSDPGKKVAIDFLCFQMILIAHFQLNGIEFHVYFFFVFFCVAKGAKGWWKDNPQNSIQSLNNTRVCILLI